MKIKFLHIGKTKLQTLRNKGQRCSPSTNRRCLGQSMVAAFAGPNQAGKKSTDYISNICVIVLIIDIDLGNVQQLNIIQCIVSAQDLQTASVTRLVLIDAST